MNSTPHNTSSVSASVSGTLASKASGKAPAASPYVKESSATNLFEISRQNIWNRYAMHLSGSSVGAFLIVSSVPLSQPAVQALSSTSAALAYGRANTTFFTLNGANNADATAINANATDKVSSANSADNAANANNVSATSADQANATVGTNDAPSLSEKDIFRVIESLDPLCLVITDLTAAEQVARAYRTRIDLEAPGAILGHACCCFADFSAMLKNEKSKQKAWSLLKTLPMKEA